MPKRRTILVVDDEPSLRFFAVRVLQNAGHLVLSAETADELMEVWTLVGRAIDLVIADVTLPGLSGIELAEQLRARRPGLKIIFVAATVEAATEAQAIGEVLYKPYTPQALTQSVEAMFIDDDG